MNDPKAALFAKLEAESSRDRSSRRRSDRLKLGGAVVLSLALFALFGGPSAFARSPELTFGVAALWGALGTIHWRASLPRQTMLGAPTRTLAASTLLLPVVLFVAWQLFDHAAPGRLRDASLVDHLKCTGIAALFTLAPAWAIASAFGGRDAVHARALGAALCAGAGSLGAILIHLHCPVSSAAHVLIGHVAVTAAFGAIGALFGERIFGISKS